MVNSVDGDLGVVDPDGVETEEGLDLMNDFEDDEEDEDSVELSQVETPEARKVRVRIEELGKNISESFFELASLIDRVHDEKLFKQWGHKKFADWAQAEFQMGRRKAYNLRKISEYFNKTLKKELPEAKHEEVVTTVKDIGWSKALELANENVITNDNVDEVLGAAKEQTVEGLRSQCRNEFKANMTDEQKEKSDDTNNMKQVRKSFQLYLSQVEVVETAIEKAKAQMKEGATDSGALTNICADFDAANDSFSLSDKLAQLEQVNNIKIVAFDPKKSEVIYGIENLEEIAGDGE